MTLSLKDLGWSPFFQRQIDGEALNVHRVTEVHRDRVNVLGPDGPATLIPVQGLSTGEIVVGDWVRSDGQEHLTEVLDRQTTLSRRAAGTDVRVQLIAANVDTLYITTSCNADFNPARLERYLALAHDAGCFPVLLLTKADLCEDPEIFIREARKLAPQLTILAVNAHDPGDIARIMAWCDKGQTAALLGSSGVGKTTLSNSMTGASEETAEIRLDDAKGRHTTTARSLRPMTNGGWLIDTPGMRALRLQDAREGIDTLFADINDLAATCRFNDCAHDREPGCAVQAAIADGTLDPDRLDRWQKLRAEDALNNETIAQKRAREKGFGKLIREVDRAMKGKKGR